MFNVPGEPAGFKFMAPETEYLDELSARVPVLKLRVISRVPNWIVLKLPVHSRVPNWIVLEL